MSKGAPVVYLAGPITGSGFGTVTEWRETAREALGRHGIGCFSPMRGKGYMSGFSDIPGSVDLCSNDTDKAIYAHPLSTSKGIVTRDRYDCTRSDLVLMNLLGATRVSVGTMVELGWADLSRRPVVLIMEPGNVHEHAFLDALCGYRVSSIADGISVALSVLLP